MKSAFHNNYMNITLRTPLCFTEIGKKDNQEDRLYPLGPDAAGRFFILCDGMGGHERGEVAAEVVSTSLGVYLQANMPAAVTPAFFRKALNSAYDKIDQTLSITGAKKPGTTLACTCFGTNGVLVAHIGDSRVYQVRPGQGVIFRTTDHSYVNELLKSGRITESEAAVHPNKNVITRAIQPGMKRRSEAEMTLLTDVKAGDFFFICCDGVLERLDDATLVRILSDTSTSDAAKMDAIKSVCDENTRDNYTAWLIPVENVEGASSSSAPVSGIPMSSAASSRQRSSSLNKLFIIIAAIVLAIVIMIIIGLSGKDGDSVSENTAPDAVENVDPAAEQEAPVTDAVSGAAQTGKKPASKQNTNPPRQRQEKPATNSVQPEKPEQPGKATGANAAAAAAAAMGGGRNGKSDTVKTDVPVPVIETTDDDPAPLK